MNWLVSTIFEARDRRVTDRGGEVHALKLYADGWAWGPHEGLDIHSMCYFLNERGAQIAEG